MVQQLAREFLDMRQMIETMAEISTKFRKRALLVPQYATDEEIWKTQYHNMLRPNIREFVSFSTCQTLDDMISRVQEYGIDLEHIGKRKRADD